MRDVNACHSRSRSAHARFRARHRSVYGHRRWYHHGAGTEYGNGIVAFFENPALVWVTGSMMLLGGLLIIAHHQYWSSLAAILISLFGWFVALRGLALLVAPQLYARGGTAALNIMPIVQIGFAVLVLIGLWLTFVGWIAKPDH